MDRLVRDDRKATVTQITTRYNQGMQNIISERTAHRTLKQMVYSCRRLHRVLLLSAKNRKRRLQFKIGQQKIGKTLHGVMSLDFCCDIQMVGSEFGVKNMKAVVSTVQAGGGGVMVWGMFSWHTLGLLVPIEHRLNTTAYLSIVVDHVMPL